MKKFNVEFSYNISVAAKNKKEAEEKAIEEFDSIDPRSDEMNLTIKELPKCNCNDCGKENPYR